MDRKYKNEKESKSEIKSDNSESESKIVEEHLEANKTVKDDIQKLVEDDKKSEATEHKLQDIKRQEDEKKVTIAKEYGHIVKHDVIAAATPDAIHLVNVVTELKLADAAARSIANRPLFSWDLPIGTSDFTFEPKDTPFTVIDGVPRFFEIRVLKNALQDPNELNVRIHTDLNNIEQIVAAREMFNETTMTARVYPVEKINGTDVGSPNDIRLGAVQVQQVESLYRTFQSYASLLETRLMYMIRVFKATDSVIYMIPKKKTVNKIVGETELHSALSTMAFFENDYPHIYLSVFFSTTPWYVSDLASMYQDAPMYLGETNTITWQNKKITSRIRAVTDQYAAGIANLTMQRLKESQLNVQDYINRCRANMFPKDDVHVRSSYNESVTNLLYSPSNVEWNLVLALIMCNRRVRDTLFKEYQELIMPTNRFTVLPLDAVWNAANGPTDNIGQQVFSTFTQRLSVGDKQSPYQLVLLECFCPWFDIRLNFPSMPSDFGAVIEILSIMLFVNTFPQIAQQTANQWGYRMNQLLDVYLPRQHNAWQTAYGDMRLNGQASSLDGRMMTRVMSQQGYVYSIFDKITTRHPNITSKYYNFITRLRELCTPLTDQIQLTRKRLARYPYYADDYNAYTSWQQLVIGDLAGQPKTEWVKRLLSITELVEDITKLRTISGNLQDTLQRATLTWLNTYYSNIRAIFESAALPFQSTMYRVQETIMNSFAFVYQRYDPSRPFNVPTDLVLSPAKLETTAMGVPLQHSNILDFDVFIAFRLLLTMEGDFKRNIQLTTRGVSQSVDALPQPSQNYLMLQGNLFDRLAMGLIEPARRFGVAMQIMKWMCDPEDRNNPFRNIAMGFRYIMRMSNWVPLLKEIFTAYGLSFEDYYIDAFSPTTGVFDGRVILLQIRELNPMTQKPEPEPKAGTIYGREIKYTDDYVRQHLEMLTVPFLNDQSPILNTIRGVYIGRFLVSELTPQQLDIEIGWDLIKILETNEAGETTRNVKWILNPLKDGQSYAIQVNRRGIEETYYLPYDKRMPAIMLEMEGLSQVPVTHKHVVAEAVHFGNLALKVNQIRVSVNLTDMPSRTINYSKEETIHELDKLISTPDGQLIGQDMITTTYATNFTQNAQTIAYYIQWVTTIEQADKNLHAAVLNSGPYPKDQTHMPSLYEVEYGRSLDNISLAFRDGSRKVDSNIINWNNEYEAVGKDLVDYHVDLEYVPAQPMNYDDFRY